MEYSFMFQASETGEMTVKKKKKKQAMKRDQGSSNSINTVLNSDQLCL